MYTKIGRNDPCPCGSGKKHKVCCLGTSAAPTASFSQDVRNRAFGALQEFAGRDDFAELRNAFAALFFGEQFFELPSSQQQRVLQNADCMGNFHYWLLFEASLEGASRTLVRKFLSRKAHQLPLPDRRYLEAMSTSRLRLYEVENVQLDEGLRLRDCWDGTVYEISERLATHQLATHSVVALRLRADPGGAMVIDGPGFAGFNHADKDAILAELHGEYEAALETDGNADGRFDFYHGVVIAQYVVHHILLRPAVKMTTTTGEPIMFCKVIFDVSDRDTARKMLAAIRELEPDNADDSYVWIRGKNRIVHALVRFEDGRIIAETHSTKRAAAVRKLLERSLASAARYRGTEEQDLQSALDEHQSRRDGVKKPETPVPAEVEAFLAEQADRHYRSWIDVPLPALANKTPRQAVRLRSLRGVLVGLLKDFTAASELERRAGRFAYDFSWMLGELGIKPEDPINMRTSRKSAKNAIGTNTVYRLKITLSGAKPPIWRRVSLSGNERLDRVHMILNCAMGWTDTHLHAFEIRGTRYSVPDPEAIYQDEDNDERKVRLADLPLTVGMSFNYSYDFGDGWEHRVLVE